MRGLRAFAYLRLFHLNEIANGCLFRYFSPGPQPRERPNRRAVAYNAILNDAGVSNCDMAADLDIPKTSPRLNSATRSDLARAFDDDLWMKNRFLAYCDLRMNVSRSRPGLHYSSTSHHR